MKSYILNLFYASYFLEKHQKECNFGLIFVSSFPQSIAAMPNRLTHAQNAFHIRTGPIEQRECSAEEIALGGTESVF